MATIKIHPEEIVDTIQANSYTDSVINPVATIGEVVRDLGSSAGMSPREARRVLVEGNGRDWRFRQASAVLDENPTLKAESSIKVGDQEFFEIEPIDKF